MTVLLVVIGAAGAALGTRAAAAAFVAAAVSGAMGDPQVAAITTWSSALAAGWLLLTDRSPRPLALPALGLAAVLAAGSATNGAVVLGLWVIATCAAVVSRGDGRSADTWALWLCGLDLVLVVCIASTAARGFEGWPQTLTVPAASVVLAAASARALVAAGPDDETWFAGLLVVRAQAVVLTAFAIRAASSGLSEAAVVVAAVAFAAAPLFGRRAVIDAVQEFALVMMALAAANLGWGPVGWEWGALAAGTLMHYLRFTVRRTRSAPFARALSVTAGVGAPLLPVVLVELEGAARAPRVLAVVVLIGLLAGLAGRTRVPLPPLSRRTARGADEVRSGAVLAVAAIASVLGVAFTLPRPPGGEAVVAPPLWAAAVVAAAAVAGARVIRVVNPGRREPFVVPWSRAMVERAAIVGDIVTPRMLWAVVGVLVICAAAMWAVGASRGFL